MGEGFIMLKSIVLLITSLTFSLNVYSACYNSSHVSKLNEAINIYNDDILDRTGLEAMEIVEKIDSDVLSILDELTSVWISELCFDNRTDVPFESAVSDFESKALCFRDFNEAFHFDVLTGESLRNKEGLKISLEHSKNAFKVTDRILNQRNCSDKINVEAKKIKDRAEELIDIME
jgi:hypothetical protein